MKALKSLLTNRYSICIIVVCGLKVLLNQDQFKRIQRWHSVELKLCSYCKLQDETINHIFVEYKFAIKLWSDLKHYCQSSFIIPILYVIAI